MSLDLLDEPTEGRLGMGSHQSARMLKDEWLTPPDLLAHLGSFDLDPCAPINPPWQTAARTFTTLDNGLQQEWAGRVWMNPPYGLEAALWLEKLAAHGNGMALIFARTETKMFFDHVWAKADALLFLRGRLYFHHVNGDRAAANSGAPSVLIAYGAENVECLRKNAGMGQYVSLRDAA